MLCVLTGGECLWSKNVCIILVEKVITPSNVKKDLTTRLNRIEGQIRGIKGMVEKDVYCDDIITQLSATQSALNSVARVLLDGHLKGCVRNRLADGDDAVLDELVTTIQKLMRK